MSLAKISRYVLPSMLIVSVRVWSAPSHSAQSNLMSAASWLSTRARSREILLEGARKEGQVTFYTRPHGRRSRV